MKKFLAAITLVLLSITSYSQEFLGIKINGKKEEVVNQLKAKGFTIVSDKNQIVRLDGTAGGKPLEVAVVSSPISKTVWKITVYLPKRSTWQSLKNEYLEYVNLLEEKYGPTEKKFDFFSKPYEEGDGYELTAVTLEKCSYAAFWDGDIGITIKISKWQQVNISYENMKNSLLDDEENKKLNSKIF